MLQLGVKIRIGREKKLLLSEVGNGGIPPPSYYPSRIIEF
jgi:hypothetical protein